MEQPDPNLRILGLQALETIIDKKTKIVFAPRILQKFQSEREYSIINYLARLLKQIIDKQNYKHILACLFDKFKKQSNLVALETLLEIEEEFIEQISEDESTLASQEQLDKQQLQTHQEFQKYFVLFIMIPLLDFFSQASGQVLKGAKPNYHLKIIDKLMIKLLQISKQRDHVPAAQEDSSEVPTSQPDPNALIVLDWAIKSVNFQFNEASQSPNQAQIQDKPDQATGNPAIANLNIYCSYLNVITINFDILKEPWATLKTEKIHQAIDNSEEANSRNVCLLSLIYLVGKLIGAVAQEGKDIASKDKTEEAAKQAQDMDSKLRQYKDLLVTIRDDYQSVQGSEEVAVACRTTLALAEI